MNPTVHTTPLEVSLIGSSTRHDPAKSYGSEIIMLLDRVWPPIKAKAIPNKGINWVIYTPGHHMFAGIEADTADAAALGLERTTLRLTHYAEWKHIGPYNKIPDACKALEQAIGAMGLRLGLPMVEIYGHWTEDESKLETTILKAIV